MALDLKEFSGKLLRCREQLRLSIGEVSTSTGIPEGRLASLEAGEIAPTGDEVLILADFYMCDYRFFVSNEKLASFEQTENMYRRYGDQFSKSDRWGVQEFLFLCECEELLIRTLQKPRTEFRYEPTGPYFKGHAEDAATRLRQHFGYGDDPVAPDVYSDFREIGLHIFRRRLDNSNISGLTVRHPAAGPCILVNYSEDIYRQRFTAAHEAAHAIMDQTDIVVSFSKWDPKNLVEIRANTFASRYLLPPRLLKRLPVPIWNQSEIVQWSMKLKVSTSLLATALKENGIIDDETYRDLTRVKVQTTLKTDPELDGLTAKSRERKKMLLERGLSAFYVSLCFDALTEGAITNARAAEMLLIDEEELSGLAEMFHVKSALYD
jgi:Zn-dependent peptidase ImmA (M78 family)